MTENNFICQYCNSSFTIKSSLVKHLKKAVKCQALRQQAERIIEMKQIEDHNSVVPVKLDDKKQLTFFDYFGDSIRVYGTSDDPYFMAKDIALILGYKDADQAIRKHVENEDKVHISKMAQIPVDSTGLPSKTGNSILINESGLYSLIIRSKLPKAKAFKRWITNEVLPSIRKTGQYQAVSEKDKRTSELERYRLFKEITCDLDSYPGMSERDKLLILDGARSVMIEDNYRSVELKESNEEWSLSRRLQQIFNITNPSAHRKLKSFGRVVAKRYRDINKKEPPTRQQFVDGTIRDVKCYYRSNYEDFIDDEIRKYFADYLTTDG